MIRVVVPVKASSISLIDLLLEVFDLHRSK